LVFNYVLFVHTFSFPLNRRGATELIY
jgi:hypothetical protein